MAKKTADDILEEALRDVLPNTLKSLKGKFVLKSDFDDQQRRMSDLEKRTKSSEAASIEKETRTIKKLTEELEQADCKIKRMNEIITKAKNGEKSLKKKLENSQKEHKKFLEGCKRLLVLPYDASEEDVQKKLMHAQRDQYGTDDGRKVQGCIRDT